MRILTSCNDQMQLRRQVFKHFQGRLAVVLSSECIAQGTGQSVEDGGLQQESLDAFGLQIQDFFDQVIQYKAVAAGKRFN